MDDAFRHDRPDFIDLLEIFGGCGKKCVDGRKGAAENGGCAGADMPDSHGGNQTGEIPVTALFNRVQQIPGGFFSHPVECGNLENLQPVEIGDALNQMMIEEQFDDRRAESVDIHRLAGGEEAETLFQARGAVDVFAPPCDLVAFPDDRSAAGRTVVRFRDLLFRSVAFFGYGPEDFGDHISRLVQKNRVTDAQILFADVVEVVKAGAADDCSRQKYRFQNGGRRHDTGPADVEFHPEEFCLLFLRRELVGDGPSGAARGAAEFALGGDVVEFHHHAVDVVGQVVAHGEEAVARLPDRVDVFAENVVGIDREPDSFQKGDLLLLGWNFDSFHIQNLVEECGKVAFGRDGGVELPERACGGVSGIGEYFFSVFLAFAVQMEKGAFRHVDFAPDFQTRKRFFQAQGNAPDGADVGGDIFAHGTVAAGGGIDEFAVFVDERDGETVDFEFGFVMRMRIGRSDAPVEVAEFLEREGVVETQQGNAVTDGLEFPQRRSRDAAGGGIRRHKIGMFGFQRFQFAHFCIVFGIFHGGGVEHIIFVIPGADELFQLIDFLFCVIHRICFLRSFCRGPVGADADLRDQRDGEGLYLFHLFLQEFSDGICLLLRGFDYEFVMNLEDQF